jgi:hypothetical protein
VRRGALAGAALCLLGIARAAARTRRRRLPSRPGREAVDLDLWEEREFNAVAFMAQRGPLVPHPRKGC